MILRLDPEVDHQQIVFLSYFFDHALDGAIVSNLILLRSFSVPRISELLDATEVFYRSGPRRAAGIARAVAELAMHGYASARGAEVIARMNKAHGRYETHNEDYVYVLSRFVLEPVWWAERFGRRPMVNQEKLALFYFWREVGRRMNVEGFPADYPQLAAFSRDFERAHCRPTAAGHRLFLALQEALLGWFPRPLRPGLRRFFPCVIEATLRRNLCIADPPSLLERLVTGLLRTRWALSRWLPPRTVPYRPFVPLVD
jgi:hypothetical protein